jgi:hypothetical protein
MYNVSDEIVKGSHSRCYDFKKNFRRKIQRNKLAFLTQNEAKLFKMLIITLVFEKNANFFAENCRKSQKIVIITSTPVLQKAIQQTKVD